jgi:hypothetical protein
MMGSGNAVIAAYSHDPITIKNVTAAQLVSPRRFPLHVIGRKTAAAQTPLRTSDVVLVNET